MPAVPGLPDCLPVLQPADGPFLHTLLRGHAGHHEYGGHGIGKEFHEDPFVCHYDTRDNNVILKPGMIFTVEPMLNSGSRHISDLNDGWTVVTRDRSLSAQWEHTVLVTETGYEVLTLSEGYPELPDFIKAKLN